MVSRIEKLKSIVEPIVEEMNYELVDLQYINEGGQWQLKVFIDNEAGITLDDCEKVSKKLDQILDDQDPIPHSYMLEVSSPGAERPLTKADDFIRFAGKQVIVKTYGPINGRRKFEGKLLGISGDNVQLELNGETVDLPLDKIARANLVLEL